MDFKSIRPITVSCENLSISVQTASAKRKERDERASNDTETTATPPISSYILNNLNFETAPGQVIAIMGASGSGKTTLLHALAGRSKHTKMEGKVLFDGRDPAPFYKNGSCGYVQQVDYLIPYLTVRETLQYLARLRLPATMVKGEKYALVENVINELGLKDCAATIIGDEWRKGISGGEKRRVSVACQLLLNPSILFLDEPSTGLDSYTSFNLVQTLKDLSKKGRTIFLTIHQPRTDISDLFDSVILLSRGKMVYSGEAGLKMINHFKSLGHSCSENSNPSDFIIDMTSIDDSDPAKEKACMEQIDHLTNAWQKLVENKDFKSLEYHIDPEIEALQVSMVSKNSTTSKRVGASVLRQILVLTQRAWSNQLRDSLMLWGNLLEVVFVSVVFGWIFFGLKENLPGVLTRRAALYITASIQTYLQLIFVIYRTCNDIRVFDRERADRIYDVLPYVASQFIAQLPFNVGFPTLFSIIMYFMIGLRTDDLAIHLFRFIIANVLAHFVVVSYSLFCVSIARDFATSSLIANSMYTFFSFSAGYFIQLDSIPVGLRWTTWWSFLTWSFRLMASNEFSNNTYACSDVGRPCQGNDVLLQLGIPVDYYIIPIIGLVANFLGFYLVAIIILQLYTPATTTHAKPLSSKDVKVYPLEKAGETSLLSNPQRINIVLDNVKLELETKNFFTGKHVASKTLIAGVSAQFPCGQLSIIMGGSGTGKSTLLNMLCGKKIPVGASNRLIETGRVLFNSKPQTKMTVSSVCSFVRQSDDHLLPALSCRETLQFAAELRLPSTMNKGDKSARVREVLSLLGLNHCANTIVGGELMKGLSGGEKRRLSIGIQMITDPPVLIIDEPTSGLDAFTANHIMQSLKDISSRGRTVICSIHQPRSDIFAVFDNILLLAKGGRVAYSGPSCNIVDHFALQDYVLPKFCNPADFILDTTSIDYRSLQAEAESTARVEGIVAKWSELPAVDRLLEDGTRGGEGTEDEKLRVRKMITFIHALPILSKRSFLNSIRQPQIIFARIMQVVFLGVIICLYYARQGYGQVSVQNRLGILQQSLSVLFVGLLNCVAVFPQERNLLFFDYSDRSYGVEPFMFAYNVIEIPVEIISAVLFTVFVMVIVNLNTSVVNFFCFALTIFCLVNLGESIGIIFCSLVMHVGFSVSMTNSVLGVVNVMSGLMSSDMPIVLDGFNRISPVPYFTRLITVNEFDSSSRFTCTTLEIENNQCLYRTGSDVLSLLTSPGSSAMPFDPNQFTLYIVVGCALTIGYRYIAYIILKWRAARSN